MNTISRIHRGSRVTAAMAVTSMLVLGACASAPPVPTSSLQAAQQAISSAERADAARYAPAELAEAHTRLASANTAVTERKMIVAERLAEQSRAEAELASARTTVAKANAVNEEMKRSTGTLMEEMQRNSGEQK